MKRDIIVKIFAVLLLVWSVVLPISAQREQTRRVTAMGSYVASKDETPAYGQLRALQEAKKQALREAGVMDNVFSTSIIKMDNNGSEFQEIFTELSRIEQEGRVRVLEQMDAKPDFYQDSKLVKYTTTIHAEVVVEETEEDLNFRFKIDGMQNTYLSGEKMSFTILPMADCYIRIFFFGKNADNNAQIYPLQGIFKDIQLHAYVPVSFPPEDNTFLYDKPFDYTLEANDEKVSVEQDVILIVALKKDYPFIDEVNYENVINWLSRIKRNERYVYWQGVNIVDR